MARLHFFILIGSFSACASSRPRSNDVVQLTQVSEVANQALMRGDVDRYRALVDIAPDFTLMSPFGGTPSRGIRPESYERMRTFFRDGDLSQEVVATYASADMIVLAVIEHARHVAVGEVPAQDWALRVTLVYRRSDSGWQLVHRHADPLAHGVTHAQAAVLGRGESAPR